ncbi:MAG: polya polymerase [Lachnospiraceae bacterium]
MKLKQNIDMAKFIACVKKCRADVYYHSTEGDSLNLKSTLSQYIFTAAAAGSNFLAGGRVDCEDEKDYAVLADFVEEG